MKPIHVRLVIAGWLLPKLLIQYRESLSVASAANRYCSALVLGTRGIGVVTASNRGFRGPVQICEGHVRRCGSAGVPPSWCARASAGTGATAARTRTRSMRSGTARRARYARSWHPRAHVPRRGCPRRKRPGSPATCGRASRTGSNLRGVCFPLARVNAPCEYLLTGRNQGDPT